MNDPRVYLAQILEATDRILKYTRDGKENFLAQELIQDAVIRNFQIIGEAAKRVPEDYRRVHDVIPWRSLAGFRDVLIHQYHGIDLAKVWRVIETDVPNLRETMARVLPPLDQLEREIAGEIPDEPGGSTR